MSKVELLSLRDFLAYLCEQEAGTIFKSWSERNSRLIYCLSARWFVLANIIEMPQTLLRVIAQ